MNLKQYIAEALEHTRQVVAALEAEQMGHSLQLMKQRGAAMAAFEEAHRQATVAERNQCQSLLEELLKQDGDLQRNCALALAEVAASFRETLDSTPGQAGPAVSASKHGCLDRKA